MTKLFTRGVEAGAKSEKERIINMLNDYFSIDYNPQENPEWDAGFQSAIALIRGGK
jgi:hypothetical protein